jgi:hypothetical protein
MDTARPLRDVFADLTGAGDAAGPAELLRDSGHPDLPDELVAEAVGSFADTAPIEVAEHLSPYVMAGSAVPLPDTTDAAPAGWYEAVSTAPTMAADPADLDALTPPGPTHVDAAAPLTMDFGHGGVDAAPDAVDDHGDAGTDHHDLVHHDVPSSPEPDDASSPAPEHHAVDHHPLDPHTLDDDSDDSPDDPDDSPDF